MFNEYGIIKRKFISGHDYYIVGLFQSPTGMLIGQRLSPNTYYQNQRNAFRAAKALGPVHAKVLTEHMGWQPLVQIAAH